MIRIADAPPDKTLLERLQASNDAAFRQLCDLFGARLYRVALGFVKNSLDAEDIAQEVLIEAYESIKGFKADCSLSTWLHRIAVNKSLDHLRSQKRKKRFAALISIMGNDNELVVEPEDHYHPGVQIEERERSQLLYAAIRKLPEQQCVAYTLNKIDELSIQETADTMKLSYKAVESLLSRARANLRHMLEKYFEERD